MKILLGGILGVVAVEILRFFRRPPLPVQDVHTDDHGQCAGCGEFWPCPTLLAAPSGHTHPLSRSRR